MKLQLIDRSRIPYGGKYQVKDRLTGLEVKGTTFRMLVERVIASRRANSVPVGLGFEEEIEQWCCQDYPNECQNVDSDRVYNRSLTFHDVINGTRLMISFYAAGKPLVERQEAENRAKICASCPYNVTFKMPCSGICGELADVVNRIIGGKGTPHDANLRSCAVCGCYLQASVWVPLDLQVKVLSDQQKAQYEALGHCWKRPSLVPN